MRWHQTCLWLSDLREEQLLRRLPLPRKLLIYIIRGGYCISLYCGIVAIVVEDFGCMPRRRFPIHLKRLQRLLLWRRRWRHYEIRRGLVETWFIVPPSCRWVKDQIIQILIAISCDDLRFWGQQYFIIHIVADKTDDSSFFCLILSEY